MPGEPPAIGRWRQSATLAGLALLVAGLAAAPWLPIEAALTAFGQRLASSGSWGPVLFVVVYIVCCVLALPGWPLTVLAGWWWGLGPGLALVSAASTLGATASFGIGRLVARDWVLAWAARRPWIEALQRAVAQRGFRVTFLLRLSPLAPFSALNYLLGVTRVTLRDYVVASWLGMLPGTLLYVYLGTLAATTAELTAGRAAAASAKLALMILGFAATAIVAWLLARAARRELAEVETPRGSGADPAGDAATS